MTTLIDTTWRSTQRDAADVARTQRELGLPGRRTGRAIYELRQERAARRVSIDTRPASVRINGVIADRYAAEIKRRGGETEIRGDRQRFGLAVADRADGLVLLHAEGWRYYTRQRSHRAELSYLCGTEDGQRWAVRVPGTITTVADALVWMTPAAVRKAVEEGKRVVRQGDIFIVETTERNDGDGRFGLPDRHSWDSETRTLSHPEHPAVSFDYPVRFIPQRALGMGRGYGTRQAYAD